MGDGERREPVGTVAEEAARLVQSLRGWAGAGSEAGTGGDTRTGSDTGTGADAAADGCACSCHRTGEAATCRLCPVCRGIALLRAVRPETLERVADVATMAAAALHDLAEQRRGDRDAPGDAQQAAPGAASEAAPGAAPEGASEEERS